MRRTKRTQHRTKRTFERQKGQNEGIQDKRAERAPFLALCFSLGARRISRGTRARCSQKTQTWLAYETEL